MPMTTALETALVQSGQGQSVRHYQGGPHFPWGLVILGGIGYIAWRKGAFDRFGGPGGPFGNGGHQGERGVQRYGASNGQVQTPGAAASGQGVARSSAARARNRGTHRQAHEEAGRAQYPAPPAPPAPPTGAPVASYDAPRGVSPTPPPTPPAPAYWASMARAAEAAGTPSAVVTHLPRRNSAEGIRRPAARRNAV